MPLYASQRREADLGRVRSHGGFTSDSANHAMDSWVETEKGKTIQTGVWAQKLAFPEKVELGLQEKAVLSV